MRSNPCPGARFGRPVFFSRAGDNPDMDHLRREYDWGELSEDELHEDPLEQFRRWFDDALDAEEPLPDAMTLATADADGAPNARIVVLRGVDERGFAFYTSYESPKGRELDANPRATLVFHWKSNERQVRIRGRIERTTREESVAYFERRPRESQVATAASPQSQVVPGRRALEALFDETARRHGDGAVPAPETWGGYRLAPDSIEFWQGRERRLHDRLRYRRDADGSWIVERLAP